MNCKFSKNGHCTVRGKRCDGCKIVCKNSKERNKSK